MKLLQKGERECDILDHLEKQGLVDEISIDLIAVSYTHLTLPTTPYV